MLIARRTLIPKQEKGNKRGEWEEREVRDVGGFIQLKVELPLFNTTSTTKLST